MLNEREIESCYLGQFIPVHYHHNMLMDQNRMLNFKSAIDYAVKPGAKVLELGGGTGVLSWFAAAKAAKVYCVEFNPDMVKEARKMLAMNPNGHKVEVVHADAFEYLPPEPVDVVIANPPFGPIKDENGGTYRAFVTRADNPYGFPSKDRSGRLEALEQPDLGKLINKCLNVDANEFAPTHTETNI